MMQNATSLVAALRRELREVIEQRVLSIFGWTLISNATELGADSVEKVDGAPDQRPVQRLEPFGFRSRPPEKVRAFWIRWGSSNVLVVGVLPSSGYGPANLAVGESAMFCAVQGAEIRLTQDGSIEGKVPAGQEINFQEGTQGVARVGDSVAGSGTYPGSASTLEGWMGLVQDAINTLAPGTFIDAPPTDIGVISSGSGTVKAGD